MSLRPLAVPLFTPPTGGKKHQPSAAPIQASYVPPQLSDDKVDEKELKRRSDVLIRLNKWACFLHSASFVAALVVTIVFAARSFQATLTTDFRVYGPTAGTFETVLRVLGQYPLVWVDLPFPFITALFHGLIAFQPTVRAQYLKNVLGERGNQLRWQEYAITASHMTWVILQLSGVTNVVLLVLAGPVANVALQAMGHLQERELYHARLRLERKVPPGTDYDGMSWVPTLVGWLIFAGQWGGVILPYFFAAVTSGQAAVPWFVYTIIIGLLLFFACFGLVQLLHLLGRPRWLRSAYHQDVAYLILSFTSKLFLTWNLLIGMALNTAQP